MATIGRPTKYNQSILDDTNAYIDNYETEHGHKIPSVAGLSLVLNIRRSTIYKWAGEDDKKEFSDILDRLNANQERLLVSSGLSGDFNSAITKLVLGKHGYHDKQEVEQSVKLYTDLSDDDLDLRLQRLEALCDQSGRD